MSSTRQSIYQTDQIVIKRLYANRQKTGVLHNPGAKSTQERLGSMFPTTPVCGFVLSVHVLLVLVLVFVLVLFLLSALFTGLELISWGRRI